MNEYEIEVEDIERVSLVSINGCLDQLCRLLRGRANDGEREHFLERDKLRQDEV